MIAGDSIVFIDEMARRQAAMLRNKISADIAGPSNSSPIDLSLNMMTRGANLKLKAVMLKLDRISAAGRNRGREICHQPQS